MTLTQPIGSLDARTAIRGAGPPAHARLNTSLARNLWDFKAAVSSSFVPLDVTCDHPDNFRGRIRSADSDQVHCYEVAAAEHVVERTPDLIARSDRRAYKVSLQLAGTGLLIQDNREALLQAGDIAIYDTQRPYSLYFDDDFRALVLMFPQHLVDLPGDMVGQLTAVRLSGDAGIGGMVSPFLTRLSTNLNQIAGDAGTQLTHSAVDLITTVLASELDLARSGNPHLALVQQIREYIETNLDSVDLSPTQIATAHFISTRHLHSIFREQGTTVSSWIRARRLEHCRADLLDEHRRQEPVAAIGARWGFVDAAHFSRVFKVAYGQSPSDVRTSAR